MSLNYQDYYELVGATQHSEFESKLKELIFEPEKRNEFYDNICIIYDGSFEPGFLFYQLKKNSPRHFHRVQEGLNLKIEDIKTIPVALPMQEMSLQELIEMQDSGEQMSLF